MVHTAVIAMAVAAAALLSVAGVQASVLPTSSTLCRASTCVYNFTVSPTLTMSDAQHITHLYPNGSLWAFHDDFDASGIYQLSEEEAATVVVADGFERMAYAVNGRLLGPTIDVVEGAEVVVRVRNRLMQQALTIHFHGMVQRGTPFMDGVPQVTQCGIEPSSDFEYRFIAEPAGTHMWHSHVGVQRPDGIFGALVVHPKPDTPDHQLRAKLCDMESTFPVVLAEWYHQSAPEAYYKRIEADFWPFGTGPTTKPYQWEREVDGRMASEVPWISGLVNGKGRYKLPDGNFSYANLTVFEVDPHKTNTACFRIVSAAMEKNFALEIDGHPNLTVFASDGYTFEPTVVQHLVVNQGESYDVSVQLNPEYIGRNFWIRLRTLEDHSSDETLIDHQARAILRYTGAPEADPDERSTRVPCTGDKPCVVLNTPFELFPPERNLTAMHVTALKSLSVEPPPQDVDYEYFLNWEFGPLGVNRRRFRTPSAPLLTQWEDAAPEPCPEDCSFNACNCTHILAVPFNKTIQFTNLGPSSFGYHPVHLHGHSYWVMGMGFPPTDPATGHMNMSDETHAVTCTPGTQCAEAAWTNGTTPPLNMVNAIRKDTVVVPPGGYTVVRLRTDNPGIWFLHCHMSGHLYYGMAMLLAVEGYHNFPPPDDFPRCGNFATNASFIQQSRAKWEAMNGVNGTHPNVVGGDGASMGRRRFRA